MTGRMAATKLLWGVGLWSVALLAPVARGAEAVDGWRGNSTGLWPEARPPVEWRRIPQGALDGLRAAADRPANPGPGDSPRVEKGLVRDWLILGPFAVGDSVRDFDRDLL